MTRHPTSSFHSIYAHGYARVAACVPHVRVADPSYNLERTVALARAAAKDGVVLTLFPELGLSAYSNDDLFHQQALLDATEAALDGLVRDTADLPTVILAGAPLRLENKLFNCAVVIHRGQILGVVPKTYLPTYREFYERRQFTPGFGAIGAEQVVAGRRVPFGSDLIFEPSDLPDFALHVEICEDVWVPIPPSTWAALAGATVIANLSASNITVGKAAYRRELVASQSGRCVAGYLYTAAGQGESTTDMAWDGHAMIYENGGQLAESKRFSPDEQMITADIDLERLATERMRWNTFNDQVARHRETLAGMRRVRFELGVGASATATIPLRREVERFPFVPSSPQQRDERCDEAYHIQVSGLVQRLAASKIDKMVIGVSGGLDSTQALIVCCRAADYLGLPRGNVLGYTMPAFATSSGTKSSAWKLMKALGVTGAEIDIRPSCTQMLKDLNHPFARGEPVHDITFENVQAGERTSHLFRLANQQGGIVVGTGDLSELALGWCTYGVGDQMSHYNVNASVPKTLIQHLIRWQTEREDLSAEARAVLRDILATEISPELIPGDAAAGTSQKTEDTIGPYDLQDFFLYYITRYGYRPSKVAFLAHHAWGDPARGTWPPGFPEANRRNYDLATIKRWLKVFCHRFFQTSQFKRSAMPNGPKVGSGGSLSPRSDWRAPSDSTATAWLAELERGVPER
jgi:NAD+ synthase (glutamine-hydrolysing)